MSIGRKNIESDLFLAQLDVWKFKLIEGTMFQETLLG